ncbi:MAG: antibiotic biosynthesis monooxygenase family protein [Cyanobacteria bacterium P01_F01_bin.150]
MTSNLKRRSLMRQFTMHKMQWISILTTSLVSLGTVACSDTQSTRTPAINPVSAQSIENSTIVEVATFTLKEGVTPDEFYAIDQAVEAQHVSQQPGFISRESAVNDDDEWLVIVRWGSIEDAEASMASFSDAPATADFMSKLEIDTMSMKRYSSYGLHD